MKLARAVSGVLLIFTLCIGSAASADDESSANRLFVSSALLMTQYEAIPAHDPDQYEARLEILKQVRQNLASIVEDHPGSSLAVQLVTENRAKTLVVAEIEAAMTGLELAIDCLADPVLGACIALEALETARGIEDASLRDRALRAVAAAQASAGDIAGALETVRGIEDLLQRDRALRAVAAAQASAGDIAGALETVRGIEELLWRAWALRAVAAAQASAGDIAGALETARGIEDARWRAEALSAVAVAQASAGDIEGANQTLRDALETARGIEDAFGRAEALIAVATALSPSQ